MSLHSRYASAEHAFNKQCRLFQRICPNLFTDLGIHDIIKTRNEEENNLIKRSKIMELQKRWDRQKGYATAYWVDLEEPILIFDSGANALVKYADLTFEDQNVIDVAVDDFEEPFNRVVRLGSKFYERLNYHRFSLLREIKKFGETVYQIHDFNEV